MKDEGIEHLTLQERLKLCDDAEKLIEASPLDEKTKREFLIANRQLRLIYQRGVKS